MQYTQTTHHHKKAPVAPQTPDSDRTIPRPSQKIGEAGASSHSEMGVRATALLEASWLYRPSPSLQCDHCLNDVQMVQVE